MRAHDADNWISPTLLSDKTVSHFAYGGSRRHRPLVGRPGCEGCRTKVSPFAAVELRRGALVHATADNLSALLTASLLRSHGARCSADFCAQIRAGSWCGSWIPKLKGAGRSGPVRQWRVLPHPWRAGDTGGEAWCGALGR